MEGWTTRGGSAWYCAKAVYHRLSGLGLLSWLEPALVGPQCPCMYFRNLMTMLQHVHRLWFAARPGCIC